MKTNADVFNELVSLDVNGHTESKNGLTYLSWAWAWDAFKRKNPDATYKVLRFENDLPYVYDDNTGYMVFTEMTVNDLTYQMWLPVMDGNNRAMKNEPYIVKTKYKDITVAPATMFDINKTIMRCLVKNMALFGLGLYIYAGADLPEAVEEETVVSAQSVQTQSCQLVIDEIKRIIDTNLTPNDERKAAFAAMLKEHIKINGKPSANYLQIKDMATAQDTLKAVVRFFNAA